MFLLDLITNLMKRGDATTYKQKADGAQEKTLIGKSELEVGILNFTINTSYIVQEYAQVSQVIFNFAMLKNIPSSSSFHCRLFAAPRPTPTHCNTLMLVQFDPPQPTPPWPLPPAMIL